MKREFLQRFYVQAFLRLLQLVAAIMMHFIRTVTVLHRQARTALSLQHLRLRMINTAMTLTDLLIILWLRNTLKVKTAALKWMRPLSAPKKVKFAAKYAGSNIIIELYSYDTKKTNSTADEIVKSVKDNGTFSIYGLPDVTAYLSDNGNYLMIYTDTAIDKTNPDKNSDNYKHREQVIKDFKAF